MFSNYTWFYSFRFSQLSFRCVVGRTPQPFHINSNKRNLSEMYSTVEKGCLYTNDYRIYFNNKDGPISPFHDIPIYANSSKKLFNMVVEVPRWTNAKMEINLKEPLNPIKQDVKKGKVRFVANCFPHHGYIWNYGAIPQTWENPSHLDDSTGCKGDNDPIDVLEIGSKIAKRGEVLEVKILGCIALIDEGETDWKLISINSKDPLAGQVNDLKDVEIFFPGLMKATVEWFKIYKIPDGKPENQFAFNGEAKNRDFALNIVEQVHNFWKALVQSETGEGEISCKNLTVNKSPHKIDVSEAKEIVQKAPDFGPPAEVDPMSIEKWHFVTLPKE
ncbi:Inorganic pyrophosphatase, putative [Pediculus humanus corporis]|uniref:Inorganic pyrophosphatase n=1 Tax=Pediculus humanus subsp. corporis TaxID=121224 RepID=E0W2T1_PEDHC|nr:Inorganic pyrophosphatase, putative [Pediculus humanus corporis]EEB19937.1 Inorganic pyrophosphatase, putative [Pediculus humanus corporis]